MERTQVTVYIDGVKYRPSKDDVKVEWNFDNGEPRVIAEWRANGFVVREIFQTPIDQPLLQRQVTVEGERSAEICIEGALYANPALYSWFTDRENCLVATGYETITLTTLEASIPSERFISVHSNGQVRQHSTTFVYTLGEGHAITRDRLQPMARNSERYWQQINRVEFEKGSKLSGLKIDTLFKIATEGLCAAVSHSGRFDASLYQYNFEWSGDASMVAEGLLYCGQFERAAKVLENILVRLSNDKGMVAESSRFRGGKDAELNNNGEILKALLTYYEWTNDLTVIERHFDRIAAIAEYLLRSEFHYDEIPLLKATRDIWERMEAMGIRPGYDISHQTFAILGLEAASKLASLVNRTENAVRWREASDAIRNVFLHHPTHSLIEDNRLIKRRLLNGEVQYEVKVDHVHGDQDYFQKFMPKGMPLANEGHAIWEPDVSECFPICYGLVSADSVVAKRTMSLLEMLWSQDWPGGGYGRYNILSEPDSPGPWPFATGFMAAAYLEMGEEHNALKAIEWLAKKAGSAGSWFEFYGDRPTPPLPPTGIIVWGWAQFVTLVVRHLLQAKVADNKLTVNPRVPNVKAELRFRDTRIII